jgi:hypothetical protein
MLMLIKRSDTFLFTRRTWVYPLLLILYRRLQIQYLLVTNLHMSNEFLYYKDAVQGKSH